MLLLLQYNYGVSGNSKFEVFKVLEDSFHFKLERVAFVALSHKVLIIWQMKTIMYEHKLSNTCNTGAVATKIKSQNWSH